MMPLVEAQDLHCEALAALTVFMQAALHDRASVGLLERISAFLVAARTNPGLRFEG